MATKFIIEVTVEDQRIEDLLIAGFEGGCNYWLAFHGDDIREQAKKFYNKKLTVEQQIILGADLKCYDAETDEFLGTLTLVKIKEALTAMSHGMDLDDKPNDHLKWHFKNFIDENDDAETADVVIQIAALKSIVFG